MEAEAKVRLTDEQALELARDASARGAPPAPSRANLGGFLRGEIAYKRAIRREEHAAEATRVNPSG